MIFRPFDMSFNYLAPREPPKDNGYYFTFVSYGNKFISSFFNYNGFVETDNAKATLIWNCGIVKSEIYQQLTPYQKVRILTFNF